MKSLVILFIDVYHYLFSFDQGLLSVLAPGGACRYKIPCSLYTKQMIQRHGLIKGLYLGTKRIISCY